MSKLRPALGEKIRERRRSLDLSQEELAKSCHFASAQIVLQIEKGERAIKASELARISNALLVNIDFFFQEEKPVLQPMVLWRDKPEKDEKIKGAEFLKLCERYHKVEELCGEVSSCKLAASRSIDIATYSFADVEALVTEEIAAILNLGSRPAASLPDVLEKRCGIKIIYQDLGKKGSAASAVGDFGAAILMNRREAPWRRNFSFAHELFHLMTWSNDLNQRMETELGLWKKVEQFADYFASILLLPENIIATELAKKGQNLTYIDVINIARDLDVSTSALLWRMVSLRYLTKEIVEKVLTDPGFKELDKSTMAEKWWEPPPLPERFVRIAFKAYALGKLSRLALADYLGKSLIDLDAALADYGINAEEESFYETTIAIV